MEFAKLKIDVSNSEETASYEADRAVMVLLNWDEKGEVHTQLVANTDVPSVFALVISACAAKLEDSDSEVAQMMGSVVRQGVEQVHEVAKAAAEQAAKETGVSVDELKEHFRTAGKDFGSVDEIKAAVGENK